MGRDPTKLCPKINHTKIYRHPYAANAKSAGMADPIRLIPEAIFRAWRIGNRTPTLGYFWVTILIDFGSRFWSIFGSRFWISILGPDFDRFWVSILGRFWVSILGTKIDPKWRPKIGTRNRPKWGPKNRPKWRPKIETQNADRTMPRNWSPT